MAKIKGIIPLQKFEVVRNRIGEILAEELANQYLLTEDEIFSSRTYIERIIPFDKTEVTALNVSLSKGHYDNENITSSDGNYIFNVDAYASSKTQGDPFDLRNRGDYLAAVKLQRLLGVCRAILKNPAYKTLGYPPPSIGRITVSRIMIADPGQGDAGINVMGRLEVTIRVVETVELVEPIMIGDHSTTIKLYETDKGYHYGPVDYFGEVLTPEDGGEELQLFSSEDGQFFFIPEIGN